MSQTHEALPSYDAANRPLHIPEEGRPTDVVAIPMISLYKKSNILNFLPTMKKQRDLEMNISERKMTREHYLQHYARNSQGDYIGTSSRAIDADLVFIPGKSSPEDTKKQVGNLAYQEHQRRNILKDKDWDPRETGPNANIINQQAGGA